MSCKFFIFILFIHFRKLFHLAATNVSFHGNDQNTAMLNRKGKNLFPLEFPHLKTNFSCPVCKVRSAFITPSKHWYENKDDKYRIIKKHKNHLK